MIGVTPPAYDPAVSTTGTALPIGSATTVRRHTRELLRQHRGAYITLVVLNAVAVLASVVGPYLLGGLVQDLARGEEDVPLRQALVWYAVALTVQIVLVQQVRLRGSMLGERMLADLREDFLTRVVGLPTDVLERAGTGELVSRVTVDVERLSRAVREAVPQLLVSTVWASLLMIALAVVAPPLALATLIAAPLLWYASRWYYRRAPAAFRSAAAGYAAMVGTLGETVEAGRTIEAYRLGGRRTALSGERVGQWAAWERYVLWLRCGILSAVSVTHMLILTAVLTGGGLFVLWGWISVGQLITGALLSQTLIDPIAQILRWSEELQVAEASMARLVGVRTIEQDAKDPSLSPTGRSLHAERVRFGYHEDVDVLHGVDLSVAPGTRVALVGPSGAGKSTLGRILAGVYAPRQGRMTLGGVELNRMPAERVREQVMLVNQEHHVFAGSLRENLILARPGADDAALWSSLEVVDVKEWAEELPDGLDTPLGPGAVPVTPAQTQQIALARIVLADPHTLVLDEATSLLDPRAARRAERTLARVLADRTVVTIAHRLHTAYDADVVAVIEDGRICELGSHDELLTADGAYASLWRTWHG
ncbi:multidrug ABC transporter ATPase [Streptomyces sp. Tue 6075]|uniref:ABC transporter ATP-binding protein n=1 Tax=Streptomyces sp. Tue 6075 TaxID=1661694 RepID=UPI00094A8673|nr:ABC transporter ATP-binding protein [Streptomyces sp. Tue 6075]APS20108.1 multidrug ABC transporter ATPase [Streptomyces sp. Tue 6075]